MTDVGEVLDEAAAASREALFAALQAAVGGITDLAYGWKKGKEGSDAALGEVLRRLRIGKPYGAPGTPERGPVP